MFAMLRLGVIAMLVLLTLALPGGGPIPTHAQPGAVIRYGEQIIGRIPQGRPEQRWSFQGTAGDIVAIDMRATETGDLDPYLMLLAPDGTLVKSDDDSGEGTNARLGPLALAATGEYGVIASRYDGSGDYVLQLRLLNTLPVLVPGKPLIGTLTPDHPDAFFRLPTPQPGTDAALFRLELAGDTADRAPVLELYGPAGLLSSTARSLENAIEPIAPAHGLWQIAAVMRAENVRSASYTLTLLPSAIELMPVGERVGFVVPAGDTSQHFFAGGQGQLANIALTCEGDASLTSTVQTLGLGPELFSGQSVGLAYAHLMLKLPATGVYVVTLEAPPDATEDIVCTLEIGFE